MATKEHANHKAAFSQMKKLGKKAREPNIFISHICTKNSNLSPLLTQKFWILFFVNAP